MGAQLSGIPDEVAAQAAAIGRRVAVARRLQRTTAAELAQRAGVSRDSISRLERGDPGVSLGVLLKVGCW